MGKLLTFSADETTQDFYPSINPRDPDNCLLVRVTDLVGVVGVMVALGETNANGFHAVCVPPAPGLLVRHVEIVGQTCVLTRINSPQDKRSLPLKSVAIVGSIIQFICNWETGERWELVRGAAREGITVKKQRQAKLQNN